MMRIPSDAISPLSRTSPASSSRSSRIMAGPAWCAGSARPHSAWTWPRVAAADTLWCPAGRRERGSAGGIAQPAAGRSQGVVTLRGGYRSGRQRLARQAAAPGGLGAGLHRPGHALAANSDQDTDLTWAALGEQVTALVVRRQRPAARNAHRGASSRVVDLAQGQVPRGPAVGDGVLHHGPLVARHGMAGPATPRRGIAGPAMTLDKRR